MLGVPFVIPTKRTVAGSDASALIAVQIAMAIRLSTAIDRRQRIRRAAKYIEATLHERPCARPTVAELAQVACMSPYHFIRWYRHAVGESPDANVRRMRLLAARQMLATSAHASVTQVAYDVGYDSVAAFGRAYRRMFGVAPSVDTHRERQQASVTWSVVESLSVRLRALRIGTNGDVWSEFDELVGHLDVGAVPRLAQDVYAVINPDGGVERAAVRETPLVRNAIRLPGYEAAGGRHLRLDGQPQSVWAALRANERLRRVRRHDEPLLLRYLNDPAYCAQADQRISLFVPLVDGARLLVK
jgi:AraC-like DNA-binding protein